MINAGIHKPDGVILEYEDAVAHDKKLEARFLVRNTLRSLNFYGAERMVRINQIPAGLEDLNYIVPHNVNLIIIPKCENKAKIININSKIDELRIKYGIKENIWLMPILEIALGIINSYEIATAAENIVAMAIGLEDYTADLGVKEQKQEMNHFLQEAI